MPNVTASITPGQVAEVFEVLFGEQTKVKPVANPVTQTQVQTVGEYVNEAQEPTAWLICDAPFAAGAGAGLTMIPKHAADEAIQSRKLPANLAENLAEVMNICSSLFQGCRHEHIRFSRMIEPNQIAGDAPWVLTDRQKSTFEIALPRYQPGQATFVW